MENKASTYEVKLENDQAVGLTLYAAARFAQGNWHCEICEKFSAFSIDEIVRHIESEHGAFELTIFAI